MRVRRRRGGGDMALIGTTGASLRHRHRRVADDAVMEHTRTMRVCMMLMMCGGKRVCLNDRQAKHCWMSSGDQSPRYGLERNFSLVRASLARVRMYVTMASPRA